MKILGLIPARGGSKGIKKKNIKLLNGKPLICYTHESALESKLLSRTIISTEDQEIKSLCESRGMDVPFMRPKSLSKDSTSSLSVVQHALNKLSKFGENYDAVCLLQPTSPFREANFIDLCIEKFIFERPDSLISVRQIPKKYSPYWALKDNNNNNTLSFFESQKRLVSRRQNLNRTYFRDGSVYITSAKTIHGNSLYGSKIAFKVNKSKKYVNIDEPSDWAEAEKYFQ